MIDRQKFLKMKKELFEKYAELKKMYEKAKENNNIGEIADIASILIIMLQQLRDIDTLLSL